jgi:hypothetical protein
MSTVIVRRIRAAPHRAATETWQVISQLLCPIEGSIRRELVSVAGIVASTIVDKWTEKQPIIVIGDGPRVRCYCLYGEEAISGEEANEDALPVMTLKGNWEIHIPFVEEELNWAIGALKKHSNHIFAYDTAIGKAASTSKAVQSAATIDLAALNRL